MALDISVSDVVASSALQEALPMLDLLTVASRSPMGIPPWELFGWHWVSVFKITDISFAAMICTSFSLHKETSSPCLHLARAVAWLWRQNLAPCCCSGSTALRILQDLGAL